MPNQPAKPPHRFRLKWKIITALSALTLLVLLFTDLLWVYSIAQTQQLTASNLNSLIAIAIGIFLFGFLLLALISLWFSDFITRQISVLQSGAEFFGAGNLDHRINLKTNDEMEDLSKSFNDMAARLQEAFQKLEGDKEIIASERNKLSMAVSSIDDAILVVDVTRKIALANKAFENTTGYSLEEITGAELEKIIQLFDKDGPIPSAKYTPDLIAGFEGVVFRGNQLKLVGKEGKESWVNLTVGQVKEGKETNVGAVLAFHDVTKERDLEEMKLDFVSMAAHELRTPLTAVRGYLSILLDDLRGKLGSEEFSFLDKAFISSTQLASLVENLLSVSRIERGAMEIETQAIDWVPVIEENYNNFLPQSQERKVKLIFNKPKKKLPLVLVDKFRISEVVSNLVGNAIAYTAPGGSVEISLEVGDKEVITHIKDTGQGIPENALPKLFTKFFRVSGVLEQGSKGTGLGLYISKAIVDMHKGRIWVESTLGKGSNFSFSIPIAKPSDIQKSKTATPGKRFFLRKRK